MLLRVKRYYQQLHWDDMYKLGLMATLFLSLSIPWKIGDAGASGMCLLHLNKVYWSLGMWPSSRIVSVLLEAESLSEVVQVLL